MQCHLPSLIIMSIGVHASVRPCVRHERPSELRAIPRWPLTPCRAGRRERSHARAETSEKRRRFGGGGKRREGRRKNGGKRRRGERKEKRREGDFAENMMAVCSSRLTAKNPVGLGAKNFYERRFSASPGRASPIITHRQ